MVGYAVAGRRRRFGRADIETAVELEGIAIDDFTGERCRKVQSQRALSGCGWADDRK